MARFSDYDDDRESPRRPSSSNTTLYVVLGILGAGLCVCLFLCAGVGVLSYRWAASAATSPWVMMDDEEESESAASEFMTYLADSDLEAAYDSTTNGFRARQSFVQFRDFVARNPALKNPDPSFSTTNVTSRSATCQISVSGRNGRTTTFTLQLLKVGEAWKVDQLTIP
jgi:hypothetical protein